MNQEKTALFSDRVAVGNRNYFFDVHESENGNRYIIINESRKVGEDFKRNSIMVFANDLLKFNQGVKNVTDFIVKESSPTTEQSANE